LRECVELVLPSSVLVGRGVILGCLCVSLCCCTAQLLPRWAMLCRCSRTGEADALVESDLTQRTQSYNDALIESSSVNGHTANNGKSNGCDGGKDGGNGGGGAGGAGGGGGGGGGGGKGGKGGGGSSGGDGGGEPANNDERLTRSNSEFWEGLSMYNRVHRHGKLVHPVRLQPRPLITVSLFLRRVGGSAPHLHCPLLLCSLARRCVALQF
jgi:hypothetical protein